MSGTQWPIWPQFPADEIAAASAVLASGKVNYWTGEEGRHFEHEFAAWCGTSRAIALHNGTLALELALRALNIGPGDEVVVTPRSFIASASCVVNVGARCVFADVDADSQNLTAASIAAVLTPRCKAIIPVHLAGWPCDMPAIMALAGQQGLAVIEDCAQAHGAALDGKRVGSFGNAAAWSFCQDKIISTAGEGGMLTTSDDALWQRAWSYKDHGKSYQAVYQRQHEPGYRWLHESIGSNWRMLEVQAAVGRIQLQKLETWQAQRTTLAMLWVSRLARWSCLRIALPEPGHLHAWYKFHVFIRPSQLKAAWTRDQILQAITARGVPCFTGGCPEIYREKAFLDRGYDTIKRLPVARELGETSLMFLVHPTLTTTHVSMMADVVDQVLNEACR
jgi:dTDP-4-amino-4,6-dideoxygalactose transaminase